MSESSNIGRDELVGAMSGAAEDFYRFGWLSATSGNMSCRLDDETVLITSTGAHLRELSDGDFVDVDFDGAPTDDGTPSGDIGVHLALYRNLDDVGAVYHVHHLQAALCSDRDHKRGFTHLSKIAMLHALGLDDPKPAANIPVLDVPYEPAKMAETIEEQISDEALEIPCLNIKNHGLYVWGETPQQTRRHVEACAYLFEYAWQRPMSPEESSSISGFGL